MPFDKKKTAKANAKSKSTFVFIVCDAGERLKRSKKYKNVRKKTL